MSPEPAPHDPTGTDSRVGHGSRARPRRHHRRRHATVVPLGLLCAVLLLAFIGAFVACSPGSGQAHPADVSSTRVGDGH